LKATDRYEVLEFAPGDYFAPVTLADIFPETPDRPAQVDLGSGDGSFLLEMAAQFPGENFLGVERLLGRVRKAARRALRQDLTNVRLLRLDSDYAVRWLLPSKSFSRVHLLFPDPWPKKKHHKRRLLQPGFLAAIHRLLLPGGEFLFKTDHPDYFEHAHTVTGAVTGFRSLDWPPDAFFHAETDFERQWVAEGKSIQRLRLRKVPATDRISPSR